MPIRLESAQSLRVELLCNGRSLGTATACVMAWFGLNFLVTNRHVLSGVYTLTGAVMSSDGARPTHIRVWHTSNLPGDPPDFYRWTDAVYPLVDDDLEPFWVEFPGEPTVDIAALRIVQLPPLTFLPHDVQAVAPERDVELSVTSPLSIVGFPFERHVQNTAIWVNATVASEPDLDFDGKPAFLVDCRARKGSSGSPVLADRSGMVATKDGSFSIGMDDGPQLVGVYSGRISAESDLGIVWKAEAVRQLLDHAATGGESAAEV